MMANLFLATAAVASPILHSGQIADRWTRPSALPEFRVDALAGHLGRAVFNVERFLDTPLSTDAAPIDAVAYFLAADFEPELDDPARRFDAARARLAVRLAELPAEQPVVVFDRWVLPLDQCLITRLVELAVHLDDLAVSLDVATPAIPADAAAVVIATLARVATARHGVLPVLRALARRERSPHPVTAF